MVAIISGATKGIGKAVSLKFAEMGFDLAIGARSKTDLELLENTIKSTYPEIKILAIPTDFSDKNQTIQFTKKVINQFGSANVIVNNVGIYTEGTIRSENDETLEKTINTNLYSAYFLTRPFLEGMKTNRSGHIFNICSVLSKTVRKEAASYSISKYALLGFNKVLAEEMREFGVKVTAILPGSVHTESWDGIDAPKEEFVQTQDIVDTIMNAYKLSANAFIEEVTIKPLNRKF